MSLDLPHPYLLFLGDATDPDEAKTAFGLRDWAPEKCLGEYGTPGCSISLGLPPLTPAQAVAIGGRALVVGVAPAGGRLKTEWILTLVEALDVGLDIISGMHTRLGAIAELSAAAERAGRRLIDVREPPCDLPVASGRRRSGKRLLTVGTDCALGKKYTALAVTRALRERGLDAEFRATGQTGIMIAGGGLPIDAVVADFVAGAAEMLSPAAAAEHWDVIEGQGSLFHPAYGGVSLGLLHGSQPDVIVACDRVGRTEISGYPGFPTPSVDELIDLTLRLARRTNPHARCAGVSLDTSSLSAADASTLLKTRSAETGRPWADPVRGGEHFKRLVDACLNS